VALQSLVKFITLQTLIYATAVAFYLLIIVAAAVCELISSEVVQI